MISLSLLLSSHLRIFQHPRVRSFTWCYPGFNLLKSRSPPLRVYCLRPDRTFRTWFPCASAAPQLRQAPDNNSQTHYAKGRRSPLRAPTPCRQMVAGTISLPSTGFFSPFPRGTCSLSVAKEYLALSGGPDRFTQCFLCTVLLGIPLEETRVFAYPAVTVYGSPFQSLQLTWSLPCWGPATPPGQVPTVWAVPLSIATTYGITSFSVPGVTEMFHFTPSCVPGL